MSTPHTTTDGSTITHNPYANVNWGRTDHCLSQFHLHEPRNPIDPESPRHDPPAAADGDADAARSTPGELVDKYQNAGYEAMAITEHEYFVDGTKYKYREVPSDVDLDVTIWPWSRWGRAGDSSGMVPIQGAELRGRFGPEDTLHDIVSLDTDLGHGGGRALGDVAESIGDTGGVSFLPHPGKYVDADSVERYVALLRTVESIVGVEAFNARDRYPDCREIWDALLTELGAERPVWAFANDDYHAKPRPAGKERFDQSRNVLLVENHSPTAVREALVQGRSYVQCNGDGTAPPIESVRVRGRTVTIEAPAATTVRWISDGERVATGADLDLDVVSGRYVRAEVAGAGGAVSCTQPIYLA